MHARRRQRDRDGYYEDRQSSYASYPSSTYADGNDRQKQAPPPQQPQQQQTAQQPAQPAPIANDYGAEIHYSPPRSPNGGMSSHGHAHSHSYGHGHSYNYGQSQNYSQSYSHNRPYSRGSHGHHRRRYNYSPEVNNTYASADNSYQHNISETERDRDYKSTRDKYTDRGPIEAKDEGERERPAHDRSERGTETRKHSSKSGKRIWNPSGTNGDWSEHISSSGKKYYYNCVSEVSQWEKPREWHEKRNKYNYSSRTGHERRESRSERESERSDRSERASHKRTGNSSHTNSYWRNNRQEYDEQRSRTILPVVLEEPPQQAFPPVCESRNRNTPLPIPEVNYNRNDYDPRTFQHVAALPRIISHSASNGSSMTPPPPPADIQQFTGPPTPTHSENHVDHPIIVELPISRRYEFGMYGNLVSVPGPALTPSLSNYMRDDLVDHVTGWPADVLERQAQRYCDEANSLAKQVTRVSSELKCARSIVREREIQATLQEQKIMYLRQQIIELEESMSQNSIMCDDLCQ